MKNLVFTTDHGFKGTDDVNVRYARDENTLITEFTAWCALQTQSCLSLILIATNYGLTALQEKCKDNRLWQIMLRDYNIELIDATKMILRMVITRTEARDIDKFDIDELVKWCVMQDLDGHIVLICNTEKLSFETLTNTTDEELIDNFAKSIDSAVRFIPDIKSATLKRSTCVNDDSSCECFNMKRYPQYIAKRLSGILYLFACHLAITALNSKYFGPDSVLPVTNKHDKGSRCNIELSKDVCG